MVLSHLSLHSFYIPVMGTGFTLDTPLKVAPFGISSVVSLVDDVLMEKVREHYCGLFKEEFVPVKSSDPDCRAKRITLYLDFLNTHIKRRFERLRSADFEPESDIHKYFRLLPETSPVKKLYKRMIATPEVSEKKRLQDELREGMKMGTIDVNIMTKLDTPAGTNKGVMDMDEYSSALAALRGFAQSKLNSAIVFSAGVNQRLYTYTSEFKDFYADSVGQMKKQIILKVKDFRSALTQGKLFAKRGLWVSAFRVESGLNCGGHAFGGQGHLLGPVMEEFKSKKDLLIETLKTIYDKALKTRELAQPTQYPRTDIQVQGGIGTHAEDEFLRSHYQVDMTGWATPFLFCPEVANVDEETLEILKKAGGKDIFLSDISPMGIPFQTLVGSSSDRERMRRKADGEFGVPCTKGYLRLNREFDQPLCVASSAYQKRKAEVIQNSDIPEEEKQEQLNAMQEKDCICHQLGNALMKNCGLPISGADQVAICPGPNGVFFSKKVSLEEMADHIYGRANVLSRPRPHLFIYEIHLNIAYLDAAAVKARRGQITPSEAASFDDILKKLQAGIAYYRDLLTTGVWQPADPESIRTHLDTLDATLRDFEEKQIPAIRAISGDV